MSEALTQLISTALLVWDTNDIDLDKVKAIETSFRDTGRQIHNIVIRPEGDAYKIVAGRHRAVAAKRLLWTQLRATVLPYGTEGDRLIAELIEIDENLCRRDLSPIQRALYVARRKKVYEKLHPDTTHGGNRRSSRQVGDLKRRDRFTRATAEASGKSERSVQRDAQRAEELGEDLARAKGTSLDKGEELDALTALRPEARKELIDRAAHGEKVSAKAAAKKEQRAAREVELGQRQMALPDKRYGVIYADPPWRFEPYSPASGMDRAADNHYPTMDINRIAGLRVMELAAEDCVLFMWVTVPMLPKAFMVLASWGFEYKSHCVWKKVFPGGQKGTGYWFRNEHELLLVGTRGNIPAPAPGLQWGSVIEAPVARHSEKPAIFRTLIEGHYPTLPRIELFARQAASGWEAWGNECDDANNDRGTGAAPSPRAEAEHPWPAGGVEALPQSETVRAGDQDCNVSGLTGEGGHIPSREGSLVPGAFSDDTPPDLELPAWLDRSNWQNGKPPGRLAAAILTATETV